MLDDAVFPRVIGDHREDSRGGQTVTHGRERGGERVEFAVDGDAHCLKQAREIAGARPRPEDGPDSADEIVARFEWTVSAASHNFAREAAALRLITEALEDGSELTLIRFVEQFSRRLPSHLPSAVRRLPCPISHSHVEQRTFPKREPPGLIIKLMRRHAEVEQDPVERDAVERGDLFKVGEVRSNRAELPR